MKVTRSIKDDGNIMSPLYAMLTSLHNQNLPFHSTEHNLRHPLAICSISEARFWAAILDLINTIGNQNDIVKICGSKELFNATKEVIGSLAAYIDDIYLIFKTAYPKSAVEKEISFANRWLEKAGCTEGKDFANVIVFAEPITLADNCIKHNHGRIGTLNLKTPIYGNALGFYIESVSDDGVITPNEKIHPKYKGKATAFSYNRFISEALSDFYFISHYASRSLQRILDKRYPEYRIEQSVVIESQTPIKVLSAYEGMLTKVLFDDEYEKCPQIEFDGDRLFIKNPADQAYIKRKFKKCLQGKIQLSFSGDGVTKSWQLPYMGR